MIPKISKIQIIYLRGEAVGDIEKIKGGFRVYSIAADEEWFETRKSHAILKIRREARDQAQKAKSAGLKRV